MSKKRRQFTQEVDIDSITSAELQRLITKAGGQRAFSRKTGIPRTTLQYKLKDIRETFGHRPPPQPVYKAPPRAGVSRFILSSAQDNTKVHEGFMANLEAYCAWLQQFGTCEILIGGFTYSKKLFTDHDPGTSWFHKLVQPYLVTDRIRIADRIDFCAEMNTLPTATNPLSGLDTYTRERWGIFPHAKVALKSVASPKHDPVKINMTTGAVTMPNYLPMKAGVKASFHHVFGAVLVEVSDDGTFFCRQLHGDQEDGAFYDLDRFVCEGEISTGHRIASMVPGDLHTQQIDPTACMTMFGCAPALPREPGARRDWVSNRTADTMIDVLRPRHLLAHDLLDWRRRNHHNINDPHDRFRLFIKGTESVRDEVDEVGDFVFEVKRDRDWVEFDVVDSNHDQALTRWLKTADIRLDPVNAIAFHEWNAKVLRAIERGDERFSIFENIVMEKLDERGVTGVRFLREDDSFRIGSVEHAMHGHRGPNGARGSMANLVTVGPRISKGHDHSAGITDGVCSAGTSSKLDMGYNAGPSSWSHSLVIQYENDKRAIITLCNGRWRL